MRKIIYITQPAFLDFDLPLIKRLSKSIDIILLIKVNPMSRNTTIFNIGNVKLKQGIFKISYIKNYLTEDFDEYLDLDKTYIYNTNYNGAKNLINIFYQFRIYWFLKINRFKIIHVNGHLGLNMIIPVFDRTIYKILNIHDPFPHSGEINKHDEWSKKINIRNSDKFILFNKIQRNDFIHKFNLASKDVRSVPIGIYETYCKKKNPGKLLINGSIRFLFFGRILPYKGIEYLIEACEILLGEGYNIECIIAGAGKLYFNSGFLNNTNKITLINRYIPEEELADLINNSHAIICPYTDATQSGVVMTSYAFGKPIIATITGGLQEMVIDGSTGFLAKPKDSVDLASTMKKFIINHESINFEANIKKYFYCGPKSWDNTVTEVLRVYNSL